MSLAKLNFFFIPCLLTCFIWTSNSCTQQNSPDSDAPVSDAAKVILTKQNHILRLKYTSGVRAILEDRLGNIWFGSHQEGVCLYDGKKLSYFTEADGLSNNQVRSVYEGEDGKIWFECGVGLSYYDGKKIITPTNKDYKAKTSWPDDTTGLWFKGDEAVGYNQPEDKPGVYHYNGEQLSFYTFPFSTLKDQNSYYSISTPFVRGKNGGIWFGTYGAAIGYRPVAPLPANLWFTLIDDKKLGLTEETGFLHVRSIFEDSKGHLWIGNNGIGVLHYDGDTVTNFSEAQGLISDGSLRSGGYRSPQNSLEHVFAIGEDAQGNIWFGDRDTGAWCYDGKTMQNFNEADGLTTSHIWQIYRSKKNELWFAMGDGSVCRFNGKSFDRIF